MSRLDRLYLLAERLRSAGGTTVPQLAAELGVAERTIQRDLVRLREQGLAVEGEAGRGGGLRLRGANLLPPLGLSLGEGLRLLLAHRLSSALGALPGSAPLDQAAGKLLAGLPADQRSGLRALLRRVVLGRAPSAALRESFGPVIPSVYAACEEAFVHACDLQIAYVDAAGAASRRVVQPHGLLIQVPLWYLLAWDPAKAGRRMFRLDRIRSARVLRSRRFPPLDPRTLFEEIGRYGIELP